MSVDGTDLSKVTGEALKATVEAAAVAAAPRAGWFLSRVAAAVLAVVLPLLGGVVGFVTGRSTTAPAAVEAPAGSGSGSGVAPGSADSPSIQAPAASGSADTEASAPRTVPYDAKMIAAEAVLGSIQAPAKSTDQARKIFDEIIANAEPIHGAHSPYQADNDERGDLVDTGDK